MSKVCDAGDGDPRVPHKSIHKHLSLRSVRLDGASLRKFGLQRLPRGGGDFIRVVCSLYVYDLRLDGYRCATRRLTTSGGSRRLLS